MSENMYTDGFDNSTYCNKKELCNETTTIEDLPKKEEVLPYVEIKVNDSSNETKEEEVKQSCYNILRKFYNLPEISEPIEFTLFFKERDYKLSALKTLDSSLLSSKGLKEINKLSYTVFLISGISGSGKSVFEKNLINDSNYFHKLPQLTTRKQREGEEFGKDYYFVDKEIYNTFYNNLIARVNFDGKSYGTLPLLKEGNCFNTCIASAEAIRQFFNSSFYETVNPTVIALLLDDYTESNANIRDGRDHDFINKEKKDLYNVYSSKLKNDIDHFFYFHVGENGRYISFNDIFSKI